MFSAVQGSNTAISGGVIDSSDNCRIRIKCPGNGLIRLFGNGNKILEAGGDSLEYAIESNGVYRVEVLKNNRGWIYSNHIRIGV